MRIAIQSLMILPFFLSCGSGLNIGLKPKIKNLMVAIEDCPGSPCTSGTHGAFKFGTTNDAPTIFGGSVPSPTGPKKIPNIEFKVDVNAEVTAPIEGVVSAVEPSANDDDSTVRISSSALSPYKIEVDHVTNVRVAVGDRVMAGQVIGNPGVWNSDAGIGRVELQVNQGGYYVCPMDFLDPSVADNLKAKLTELLEDWEEVKSDSTLYNEASMVVSGCMEREIAENAL